MSRISIVTLVSATLLAIGTAYWIDASEPRKWPKPTPPPPPSPIYYEVNEPMPSEEDIALAAEQHTARLQQEIEQALASGDDDRIEAAFVFLLPELIQVEPQRVVQMVASHERSATRERLLRAVARQWVVTDLPAAVEWMKSLEEQERRQVTRVGIRELRPIDPSQATLLANQLGVALEDEPERVTAR